MYNNNNKKKMEGMAVNKYTTIEREVEVIL